MIKLPHSKIVALANAINSLDNEAQAVRDKDGNAIGMERKPAMLPWAVSYGLARTADRLETIVKAVKRSELAIVSKYSSGKLKIDDDNPKAVDAQGELNALMDQEVEVDVYMVKIKSIETCKLPPSIIKALLPVIDIEP